MIELVNQNLLDAKVDVIIQSNNCFATQGAGIAKLIKEKYPEVYSADLNLKARPEDRLGKILPVKLLRVERPYYCFLNFNQFNYGRERRHVNYEAFYTCLEKTKQKCFELKLTSLALPANMSCNNAGGAWEICYAMIEDVFRYAELKVFICRI